MRYPGLCRVFGGKKILGASILIPTTLDIAVNVAKADTLVDSTTAGGAFLGYIGFLGAHVVHQDADTILRANRVNVRKGAKIVCAAQAAVYSTLIGLFMAANLNDMKYGENPETRDLIINETTPEAP